MSLILTKSEIFDIMEDHQPVKTWPAKWGTWQRFHVVRDGKDYVVDVEVHITEGVQDDSFYLQPAKRIVKTIEEWVPDPIE